MTSTSSLLRSLLIYSICLPLAIFLGYVIAQEGNPLFNRWTYFIVGLVIFVLALPLILRWHHALLIVTWSLGAVLFFVPGRPDLWWAVAWLSFCIAIVQHILNRRTFLRARGVARSLIFLAVVVLATALLRGGIGLAAFGSEVQGGKRYLMIFTAIAGYFALVSQPIPPNRATLFVTLFFLSAITSTISELGPILPSGLYYIFLLFPISSYGMHAILNDPGATAGMVARLGGFAYAGSAAVWAMMARYGIRQLFDLRHFLRLLIFLACVVVGFLGGFRSVLVQFMLTFSVVFWLEGLIRHRRFPLVLFAVVLGSVVLVATVEHLPLSVQRTLSVLPLHVDPVARKDAEASSEWRINIWKHLVPQIPRYLLVGKGLGFNANDLQSMISIRPATGIGEASIEGVELVADYHNGPLSVIVPFGIFGVIGFLWFLIASFQVLRQNYHYGHPAFRRLNTFLYGFFIARTIFFFAVFGNLYSELAFFAGLVGMSISLNGGVAKRMILVPARIRQHPPQPVPGARKPTAVAA
jgi:O-Antigen ligase